MKGNKSKKALIVLIAVVMVFAFGIQCYATEGTNGEKGTQTTESKVSIEKKVEGTSGSISFVITGVDFEAGKNYEYTLSKTEGVPENAKFIDVSMDYSKKQVMITVTDDSYYTNDGERESLVRKVNTAYLFVREKETQKYILEKTKLDLTLPFKSVLSVHLCENSSGEYAGGIKIGTNSKYQLYNFELKDISYVFEKVTDNTVIDKYQKSKNSDEILDPLKNSDIPDSKWDKLTFPNYFADANIYGESMPKDNGLYILWLKLQKDGNKVVYGAWIYDKLGAASSNPEKEPDSGTVTELTATVSYNPTETTTGTVTATIKTNKKVNKVEGWTISNDGKTLTKTYSKNQTETVTLKDEDGKTKNVEVKVSNITTKIAEDSGKDQGKDETVVPSKKLPQTGESYVVLAVAGVVVLAGVIGVIRYRKYKGI